MNYGHSVTVGTYSTAQVESDLNYLVSRGITRVRIVLPLYGGPAIADCQDMVLRALAHGLYVVWGVATGVTAPNLTATIWAAYKTYVTGTLAPWAQANGLSEMLLGNECDYEADGSTLTAATVRSDVLAMATSLKAGGYTGKVGYSTAAVSTLWIAWNALGTVSLDTLGFNSYDTLTNFTNRCSIFVTDFGSKAYISEFGCINSGFADYNDETLWYTDVAARITAMMDASIPAGYFFCYRDGAFGVPANSFGLVETNGTSVRVAREAVLFTPGQNYSSFAAHS